MSQEAIAAKPCRASTAKRAVRRFRAPAGGPARTACAEWLLRARSTVLGLTAAACLASTAHAESLKSLHVWVASGTAEVYADTALPAGVSLEVFDVAGVDQGEAIMNDWVMSRIDPQLSGDDMVQAYTRLASEFLNTSGFEAMKEKVELGAHAIQGAVYFRIEKLPAIVINEKYTLYNVTSLDEAISIFEKQVP